MPLPTTLAALAAREHALCTYTDSLTGTLEVKMQQLEEAGIFAAYAEIYTEYLIAYQATMDDSEKLEALKRLAFLSWYGLLEPSFISGIGELSETGIRTTYAWLDEHLRRQELDDELHWMLSFYASWDFLLLPFIEPQLPSLTAFIEGVDPTVGHVPAHPSPWLAMDNRGQMGLYWQRIRG
jgi:hypothetical protein